MAQATACRAVIYGFNSHPQLFGIHSYTLDESAYLLAFSEKFDFIYFANVFLSSFSARL